MQKSEIDIFPTTLTLVNEFLTQQQCRDVVNYYKNSKNFIDHNLLVGGGYSTYSRTSRALQDIENNIPSCAGIVRRICHLVEEYSSRTGLGGTALNNSWMNIQQIGSKLIKHAHGGSCISGALYLNTDENSSRMHFFNPNQLLSYSIVDENTDYTYMSYWIKPNIGDLIIFPSWLSHGSCDDINGTKDRMILSFNTSNG